MVTFRAHCDLNRRTPSVLAERGTWPPTGYFMQRRTELGLRPALVALTCAAAAIAFAPASHAAPEDTCLRAPKGGAPQGSHWYYRIERPSMRKCWYLADKGLTVARRAAARTAPQTESNANVDDAPAPVPAAESVPATPVAEPTPVITTLITRNVSNMEGAPPPAATESTPPPPSATTPTSSAAAETQGAPVEQAPSVQQASPVVTERAPALGAADNVARDSTESMSMLQLLLGAIALFGLIASGAFLITGVLRRRNDVLNTQRETDALPYEPSPEMVEEEGPAFQPLRALDPIRQRDLDPLRQHDDVDEILQRLARRRRAA